MHNIWWASSERLDHRCPANAFIVEIGGLADRFLMEMEENVNSGDPKWDVHDFMQGSVAYPIDSFLCFGDDDFYLHSFTSLICQLFYECQI